MISFQMVECAVESPCIRLPIAHSTIIKDIMVVGIWSQQDLHQTFYTFHENWYYFIRKSFTKQHKTPWLFFFWKNYLFKCSIDDKVSQIHSKVIGKLKGRSGDHWSRYILGFRKWLFGQPHDHNHQKHWVQQRSLLENFGNESVNVPFGNVNFSSILSS